MKKAVRIGVYIIVLFLSAAFIYCGHSYTQRDGSDGTIYDKETELDTMVFATVLSIDAIAEPAENALGTEISFTAETFGDKNSRMIHAKQIWKSDQPDSQRISVGDKVVLLPYGDAYLFQYFYRLDKVLILGLLYACFVVFMGGAKGFRTVLSLLLTCLSVFFVYIPSIRAGQDIYLSSVIICMYIIIMTLIIVYGVNQKSITAILSCIAGVFFSSILTHITDRWMKLTGYINEDMYMLHGLLGIDIDVKALIFSMITLGALGAVMDVAISITSALSELKESNPSTSRLSFIKSGFNIGKDVMGTMTNTLILAYIGSSLTVVLLYSASNYPLLSLLNKEEIIFEFLQSLIGSLSLLFTLPITILLASFILSKPDKLYSRKMG